jgi:hypothetical protein
MRKIETIPVSTAGVGGRGVGGDTMLRGYFTANEEGRDDFAEDISLKKDVASSSVAS